MSVQDDVKASLDKLFGTVVKDELGIVRPVADGYLTAIVSSPDINNIVAQSLSYETQFIALLPQVEQSAAKDTAASLKALIDLEGDKILNLTAGTIASVASAPSGTTAPASVVAS